MSDQQAYAYTKCKIIWDEANFYQAQNIIIVFSRIANSFINIKKFVILLYLLF